MGDRIVRVVVDVILCGIFVAAAAVAVVAVGRPRRRSRRFAGESVAAVGVLLFVGGAFLKVKADDDITFAAWWLPTLAVSAGLIAVGALWYMLRRVAEWRRG